jgi:hypothetical protein
MGLAGGCVTKNLVRAGGGNGKSMVVLVVAGWCAWGLTRTGIYGWAVAPWLGPLALDLGGYGLIDQRLGSLLASALGVPASPMVQGGTAALVALTLGVLALATRPAPRRRATLRGGAAVGLAVVAGWWLTAGPLGRAWVIEAAFEPIPPPGVGVQSYTFVAPLAETGAALLHLKDPRLITFGVTAVLGLLAGSFLYHASTGRLRCEWFTSRADAARHLVGAALLGTGGVLALGCSVGQGVTGLSTLALGSFLAVGAMVAGMRLALWGLYRWA